MYSREHSKKTIVTGNIQKPGLCCIFILTKEQRKVSKNKNSDGSHLSRCHVDHAGTHDTYGMRFNKLPYTLQKCKCDDENYN